MTKRDKLLQRIQNQGDVDFSEVMQLLTEMGFTYTVKGSHHTFRKKPDGPRITIVKRNPIHREAVKELKKVLEKSQD